MRWLIAAALLVFAGEAQAYVRSGVGVVGHGFHRVVASAPVLVGDGVTAGLDFNFASGSFTQAGQAGTTPATLLTVTRASTKLCDDLAGNWSQVAANVLCWSNKGALIEEARTNLVPNTAATSLWSVSNVVTTPGVASPASDTTAFTVTDNSNNNNHLAYVTAGTGVVGATQNYTVSALIKNATSRYAAIGLGTGGFASAFYATVDTVAGTITNSGVAGAAGPTYVRSSIIVYPNGWMQVQVTGTIGSAVNAFPLMGVTNAAGNTVLTAYAGTGQSASFWNPQVEAGDFATSPIVTAGAAATRAADVVKATITPTMGAAYTMYASGTPVAPLAAPVTQTAVFVNDGTFSNGVRIVRSTPSGASSNQIRIANVANNGASGVWGVAVFGKLASSFAAGAQNLVFSGGAPAATAFALPGSLTALDIGEATAGTGQQWNGYLSRVALWPATALTTGALQSITSGGGP